MIESRHGKYAVVLLLFALAAMLGASRPKKPRIVYPLAIIVGVSAAWVAWRIKPAAPLNPRFPLGDPQAFIVAVPNHVTQLAWWAQRRGIPHPPRSAADMDEWLWLNREALGEEWATTMHGLVAAYGEALRADAPSLVWSVRGGEPAVGSPRSLWPARRVFNEVHDAVFADL